MCGIIGYVGASQGTPVMMEGLAKLSYRGYDSAGLAVLQGGQLKIIKKRGKVNVLEEEVARANLNSHIGIAHTRWATHGEPSDINAHPHADCSGQIAVVHNGIIENYLHLKKHLQDKGHVFVSHTDSEVLAHLIEDHYQGDLEQAVRAALQRLIGAFAIVVICRNDDSRLIVARKDCPLILGLGEQENYIASDIPVLLSYTQKFIVLENGEMASVTPHEVVVTNFNGELREKQPQVVDWELGKVEKQGYDHFMLKEIHEQPRSIRDTLRGRLQEDGRVVLDDIVISDEFISRLKRIYIVACGTAYHAAMIGEHIFEDLLRIPVEVDLASEFRYRDPILDEHTLVIAISQSGETADTLASVKEARAKGSKVLAIANVVNSSIVREADYTLYTRAGAEIAVASTKAFTAQQIALFLVALRFSQHAGRIAGGVLAEVAKYLEDLPAQVQSMLDNQFPIKEICQRLADRTGDDPQAPFKYNNCFFIGRGLDDPIAREGALKLKEISYIHADAYPAGELKHGNIALITKETPVIALLTQDRVREKMISNIMEVVCREAPVIVVAYEDDGEIEEIIPPFDGLASNIVRIPRTISWLAPILAAIPLQLLAYYTGVNRGCDVDQPRNLAKSVTVE
jgi:glucosamine--fructose-6-phosphate aminotransferase (isomerizing)